MTRSANDENSREALGLVAEVSVFGNVSGRVPCVDADDASSSFWSNDEPRDGPKKLLQFTIPSVCKSGPPNRGNAGIVSVSPMSSKPEIPSGDDGRPRDSEKLGEVDESGELDFTNDLGEEVDEAGSIDDLFLDFACF